ncbi:MAG: hypothetical protein ABL995_20000 [Bryobacteraceae bacterium]
MRNGFLVNTGWSRAAMVAVLGAMGASLALAQNDLVGRTEGKMEDALLSSDTDKGAFNKHEFNGLWARNPQVYGLPRCPECGDPGPWPRASYGFHGTFPPRTAEGEKLFNANKTARGIEKDSAEAKRRTDLDIGLRRAILPAFGNDPEARCEPLGLARLITFSGGGATMEMMHSPTNDKILQRFEWTWDNREIWTDGRKLPKVDDYLPRYTGYSVGHWEGDTLVVTSTGFDDRQWLDQYGYPVSSEAVLEERWERPSKNRLRVQLTLIDPKLYSAPWKSSYKVWTLIPKEKMAIAGWSGILEDRCVPSDEALFNTFRDHAAGKK